MLNRMYTVVGLIIAWIAVIICSAVFVSTLNLNALWLTFIIGVPAYIMSIEMLSENTKREES